MTNAAARPVTRGRAHVLDVWLLVAGLSAAVALRVSYAGSAGAASESAGLVFAMVLIGLAGAARTRVRLERGPVVAGVIGAGVLIAPVAVRHLVSGSPFVTSTSGYAAWAAVTAVVATAEEAFLRGALFDALWRWRGEGAAVIGAAVAFAALHVPLYGWRVIPLDLAVGVALGALRVATGGWLAPAIAHCGADLAGWWLV